MAMHIQELASGPGWSVRDIVCSSGPHDRPFEERHEAVCIAAVMQGSFQYCTAQGAATLVPGAVLLGDHHSCFECSHEHGVGDHCISFMFDPICFDSVVSSIQGVCGAGFHLPGLPPLMAMTGVFSEIELALLNNDIMQLEQVALDIAAAAVGLAADAARSGPGPTSRDQRRIATALRRIEHEAAMPLSIDQLAREAAMSPYHFLRTFRRVVGMTPHQFILRTRLQNAAVRLRTSSQTILDIALDAGFSDLSTFNRRFRTIMGMAPGAYRQARTTGAV